MFFSSFSDVLFLTFNRSSFLIFGGRSQIFQLFYSCFFKYFYVIHSISYSFLGSFSFIFWPYFNSYLNFWFQQSLEWFSIILALLIIISYLFQRPLRCFCLLFMIFFIFFTFKKLHLFLNHISNSLFYIFDFFLLDWCHLLCSFLFIFFYLDNIYHHLHFYF